MSNFESKSKENEKKNSRVKGLLELYRPILDYIDEIENPDRDSIESFKKYFRDVQLAGERSAENILDEQLTLGYWTGKLDAAHKSNNSTYDQIKSLFENFNLKGLLFPRSKYPDLYKVIDEVQKKLPEVLK